MIVVDDDVNVRRLFHDALETAGMRTHTTASGEEALRLARGLPRGLRGARRRADAAHGRLGSQRDLRRVRPELPVVLVTADRLLSIRGSVRDKPVSADDIAALVRTNCPAQAA